MHLQQILPHLRFPLRSPPSAPSQPDKGLAGGRLGRAGQHLAILYFIAMTSYAFTFTMVRVQIPFIPWPLLRFHYGMMAPYQGYSMTNADLLAEGKRSDGSWERIDLAPYYPTIRGTQIMYRRLRSYFALGNAAHTDAYRKLALLLLEREQRKGRTYEAIRLTWQQWPVSPLGFEAMRTEELTENVFITQVP